MSLTQITLVAGNNPDGSIDLTWSFDNSSNLISSKVIKAVITGMPTTNQTNISPYCQKINLDQLLDQNFTIEADSLVPNNLYAFNLQVYFIANKNCTPSNIPQQVFSNQQLLYIVDAPSTPVIQGNPSFSVTDPSLNTTVTFTLANTGDNSSNIVVQTFLNFFDNSLNVPSQTAVVLSNNAASNTTTYQYTFNRFQAAINSSCDASNSTVMLNLQIGCSYDISIVVMNSTGIPSEMSAPVKAVSVSTAPSPIPQANVYTPVWSNSDVSNNLMTASFLPIADANGIDSWTLNLYDASNSVVSSTTITNSPGVIGTVQTLTYDITPTSANGKNYFTGVIVTNSDGSSAETYSLNKLNVVSFPGYPYNTSATTSTYVSPGTWNFNGDVVFGSLDASSNVSVQVTVLDASKNRVTAITYSLLKDPSNNSHFSGSQTINTFTPAFYYMQFSSGNSFYNPTYFTADIAVTSTVTVAPVITQLQTYLSPLRVDYQYGPSNVTYPISVNVVYTSTLQLNTLVVLSQPSITSGPPVPQSINLTGATGYGLPAVLVLSNAAGTANQALGAPIPTPV